MGRGRQKAKHQKVARELKYHSTSIDTDALQRELSGGGGDDRYEDHYGDSYAGADGDGTSEDYASPSRGL